MWVGRWMRRNGSQTGLTPTALHSEPWVGGHTRDPKTRNGFDTVRPRSGLVFHEPRLDRGRPGRFRPIHYPRAWVTSIQSGQDARGPVHGR
jgi:hypothetical protein